MKERFAFGIVGTLIVTIFIAVIYWLLNHWGEAQFSRNALRIDVCRCNPQASLDSIEIRQILAFYPKQNVSTNVDFLVPFVTSDLGDPFALPCKGLSNIAQRWAPTTYRNEYRLNDETLFWESRQYSDDAYAQFLKRIALTVVPCDSTNSKDYSRIYDVHLDALDGTDCNPGVYRTIPEWRENGLNDDIESEKLTNTSRVLLRLSCQGCQVKGCMDSKACNFNPQATVGDESCRFKDSNGHCDGVCSQDIDHDGKCDDTDDCIGSYDALGKCNGNCMEARGSKCIRYRDGKPITANNSRNNKSGSTNQSVEYSALLFNKEGYFLFQGTLPGQKIRFTITDQTTGKLIATGMTETHDRFPNNQTSGGKTEADRIWNTLNPPNPNNTIDLSAKTEDLAVRFEITNPGSASIIYSFKDISWVCYRNGGCGPINKDKSGEENVFPSN